MGIKPCLIASIRLTKPKASRKESKKNPVGLKSGHDANLIHPTLNAILQRGLWHQRRTRLGERHDRSALLRLHPGLLAGCGRACGPGGGGPRFTPQQPAHGGSLRGGDPGCGLHGYLRGRPAYPRIGLLRADSRRTVPGGHRQPHPV